LFPKDVIEKDAPGGVHILLEGTTDDAVPLVALGYRYSHKRIFILYLPIMGGAPSWEILTT
jgi:hypothetical protein